MGDAMTDPNLPNLIVAWVNAFGTLLLPVIVLVVAFMFRKAIRSWLETANRLAIGPLELTREIRDIADKSRMLLDDTEKLQVLLAESRAIEVKVFLNYPLLDERQRAEMLENLKKLEDQIKRLRQE